MPSMSSFVSIWTQPVKTTVSMFRIVKVLELFRYIP